MGANVTFSAGMPSSKGLNVYSSKAPRFLGRVITSTTYMPIANSTPNTPIPPPTPPNRTCLNEGRNHRNFRNIALANLSLYPIGIQLYPLTYYYITITLEGALFMPSYLLHAANISMDVTS